jgi:hypothetical protein
MERLPTALICVNAQYVIDDPDAIEVLLREDPSIEKCLPLALKEAFNIATIPNTNTMLESLLILWRDIPEEKDRDDIYTDAASKGLTYLLSYIIANPNQHLAWTALTWAIKYGHIDTIQFLINGPLRSILTAWGAPGDLLDMLKRAISNMQLATIIYFINLIRNIAPDELSDILSDAYDHADRIVRTKTELPPEIDQVYAILNAVAGQHRTRPIV